MRLIGMLDSPYVRRVAISLDSLGVPFDHEPVSVFSNFEEFRKINPVVKAPTLICDDGEVIMDSSLIIQFFDGGMSQKRSLWSADAKIRQHEFSAVSLALAACDKSVQIVYERKLRPKEAQYEPWMERVTGQVLAAFSGLEAIAQRQDVLFAGNLNQVSITAAVVWQFTQSMLSSVVPESNHPHLVSLSAQLEKSAVFKKYSPVGPGV